MHQIFWWQQITQIGDIDCNYGFGRTGNGEKKRHCMKREIRTKRVALTKAIANNPNNATSEMVWKQGSECANFELF